jgi:hypothetical protein
MKFNPYVLLVVLLLGGILFSGCLSSSPPTPPPVTSPSSPIRAVVASMNEEWSFSLGCYTVVTGYVDNNGASPVHDAIVYLSLTYPGGMIRDSRSIYLGSIGAQESRNYQVILDRECGDEYAIDFKFSGTTDANAPV